MHSVPILLFLVLFVQTTTGELSLPSLPQAVQLLQLETIRGLEQTILEKENENRRLEEMIRNLEMEKEVVTHNYTMMEEFDNTSRTSGEVGVADVATCSCLPRSTSTNQLRPTRIDFQCQDDTNRSFQLPCSDGVCTSRELPSCTESLEWEEEQVGFEKCQELSFNGASVLCGVNGTKETTRKLHIGGGIVEEVVTTPCNDCGDLSAALEWTAWAPCVNETIEETRGRVIEGMLCRRRGNTYMGFEEEEIICEAPWTQLSTGCYRFHESPLTQSEAKKFCEEEQEVPAHLVEIDSMEENRAIVAEIKRRNFESRKIEFWLGITDRHSEGHWVLESTGKRVVFTDWHSGEPNNRGIGNGNENCAHINYHYMWNDRNCTYGTDPRWPGSIWTALCEKRRGNPHMGFEKEDQGALKAQRENENSSSTPIPTSAAAALHDNVMAKNVDTFAAPSVDARLGDLYWNTSNPMFNISNTDHIMEVVLGDRITIICPHHLDGHQPQEQHVIYSVTREEYLSCSIQRPRPRIIAKCTEQSLKKYTFKFRSFSPMPGGIEFLPGKDYYFISTSSPENIHSRSGGYCQSHNMKVVFKVMSERQKEAVEEQKEVVEEQKEVLQVPKV